MSAVDLARLQFALTVGFHFLFPPASIGLAWLIVWLLARRRRTGDEVYGRLARLWVRILGITFALGVASGITMEFQFGMNWSEYSRFVGDIFGAPLAIEAVIAFFLESTFLGVLLFGWNRVSPRAHFVSALMVAVGATLSAFWIIVANSWQQTPAGYAIVGGRAQLTDVWAAVFNPSTLPRFFHTMDAALITGGFMMAGLSAWMLRKSLHVDLAKVSLRAGLTLAFVASVAQLILGHWHGVQVAVTQPAKLAAQHSLFETRTRAPMLLFGIPDQQAERVRLGVELPGMLSLLAFSGLDAKVTGLKDAAPKNEWPPVAATYYSFHLMVVLGLAFIAVAGLGILLLWRGTVYENRRYLGVLFWTMLLPFVANELGWVTAEVGRQPWVVWHVLKTADGVSLSVPPWQIGLSLVAFVVIYALLFYFWVYLLRRQLERGADGPVPVTVTEGVSS